MIGGYVKARRIELNLSQSELARCVGVSKTAIGAWEKGLYKPNIESLSALEKALRVPIGTLYLMEGFSANSSKTENTKGE